MLNTIKKSNVVNNIQKTFRHKAFDNFGSKVVSAISALAIINASVYSGQLGAQTQATYEEVVVTARKKEEGLQSVPLSVSALGEETLEEKGINVFEDYLLQLPGVTAGGSGPRTEYNLY
jgi:outer membrane receptor protein involved in Fe transport